MEESLQARVSLEQILGLPELKVPAPTRPLLCILIEIMWSLVTILVFSV